MSPTRFALDHLTIADAAPLQLVEIAHAVGCRAVCLFLQSMEVLPRMPAFELSGDQNACRALKERMDGLGVGLDVAYPFTLSGRTDIDNFRPAMACAAFLGAKAVNVLAYDREPARRFANFASFCDLARSFGLGVVLEFYPLSQVRSLADALALTGQIGRPNEVGVMVDLLHLMRSGGTVQDVAAAPAALIHYAQYCDGPTLCPPEHLDFEASSQRLLPGAGTFDLAGFAVSLPPSCPASVELPQDDALAAGVAGLARARRAIDEVFTALSVKAPQAAG